MKRRFAILILFLGNLAGAAEPGLPADDIVARVLRAKPSVQAADSQIEVEQANRSRLEAGPYEWSVRLGAQQRRANPTSGPDERFNEWNAALERAVRLPGKSAIDTELGSAGVSLAETARGDALHEASRQLLKAWFVWLKESAAARQWAAQVALLDKQATATRRRQELGDAARLEAVQAEAALAQAEAQLSQARVRQGSAAEDLRRRYPGLPLNEPASLADPTPLEGSAGEWIAAVLEHSHELAMARGEVRQTRLVASRSSRDRLPDPTFGLQVARERAGEDQIVGAYVSIPLPGGARRATADATRAQAAAADRRESAVEQKIGAEAATLYQSAHAAYATWQAARSAAERQGRAAEMTARAYQLGEGSLNDLLAARRLANEAELAARLLHLEALELHYRLRLDTHRLWDLD